MTFTCLVEKGGSRDEDGYMKESLSIHDEADTSLMITRSKGVFDRSWRHISKVRLYSQTWNEYGIASTVESWNKTTCLRF
jgi:hypothetical protein